MTIFMFLHNIFFRYLRKIFIFGHLEKNVFSKYEGKKKMRRVFGGGIRDTQTKKEGKTQSEDKKNEM